MLSSAERAFCLRVILPEKFFVFFFKSGGRPFRVWLEKNRLKKRFASGFLAQYIINWFPPGASFAAPGFLLKIEKARIQRRPANSIISYVAY